MIQFDKSCEEMLELSVGDHPMASGGAVKVGDKFGLRISLDHPARRTLSGGRAGTAVTFEPGVSRGFVGTSDLGLTGEPQFGSACTGSLWL